MGATSMERLFRQLRSRPEYRQIPGLQRPTPQGFPAYADLAVRMFSASIALQSPAAVGSVAAAYAGAARALWTDAPLLHLTPELGAAFLATAVPELSDELRIPYPAFTLNLPNGLLYSDAGERVLAVVVADSDDVRAWIQTDWLSSMRAVDPLYGTSVRPYVLPHQDADLIVAALLSTGAVEYLHFDFGRLIDMANRSLPPEIGHGAPSYLVGRSEIAPELAKLALNAILLMQNMPELLTDESVEALPRKGFGGGRYKGSIRWLGKHYQRRLSSGHGMARSTGMVMAPHWRRGHWHRVVHGPGRQERRLQWFQPVYVNALAAVQAA